MRLRFPECVVIVIIGLLILVAAVAAGAKINHASGK
jgi:hypothetical protein